MSAELGVRSEGKTRSGECGARSGKQRRKQWVLSTEYRVQDERNAAPDALGHPARVRHLAERQLEAGRDAVDDLEPDVVARALVFAAGISDPDDDPAVGHVLRNVRKALRKTSP